MTFLSPAPLKKRLVSDVLVIGYTCIIYLDPVSCCMLSTLRGLHFLSDRVCESIIASFPVGRVITRMVSFINAANQ